LLKDRIKEFKNMSSAKSPDGYSPKNAPYKPLLLLSVIVGQKGNEDVLKDLKKIPMNPISESDSGIRGIYKDLKKSLDLDRGSINIPLGALRNENILGFKFNKNRLLFSIDNSIFSENSLTPDLKDKFEDEGHILKDNTRLVRHNEGFWIKSGKSKEYWIELGQSKAQVYREFDRQPSLGDFENDVDYIYLADDWIEVVNDNESCRRLIEKILDDERYFSEKGKEKLKDKIQNIIDHPLETEESKEEMDVSYKKDSISDTSSNEKNLKTKLDDNLSQRHLEEIIDKSKIDINEILDLIERGGKRSKSRLILALESSQDNRILEDERFKDQIIDLILKKDEDVIKENLKSLLHTSYDNPIYFINKFLVLLDDDDPKIRSNAAESLRIFDTQKVNKHLINKLYDDSVEVKFSALKTLLRNDNYDFSEIERALEDWKVSLQAQEEGGNDELKSEKEDNKSGSSVVEKEFVDKSLSWKDAVKEAIKKVVKRKGELTFSRQTLIEEEIDYIKEATGTKGTSSKQALSDTLQHLWKKENFISHERKGVYKLQKGEAKREFEPKKTEYKTSRKEKEKLLGDISEEKIDLKEVKDQIIRYSEYEYFLEQLLGNINDLDWKNRYQLVKIISEINEKIVLEKLTELLEDPNEWVREASAEALTNFPSQDLIPKLADVFKSSKKGRSRIYAAEILGEFDSEKALDALSKALEDEAPSVREEAINSINKISHKKSMEILKKAKKSEFADVKREAERILRRPKYNTSESKKKPKKVKRNDSLFTNGSVYLRNKIHERLGGNENSKLSRSSNNSHIFLFYRKDEEYKLPFGWQEDGSFHFILDKFEHDIQFEDLSSLIKRKKNNQKIHLFRDLKGNKAKYQGEMNIGKYNIIKVKGEVKKIILKLFPIEKSTKETNTNENKDSDNRESSKSNTMNQVSSDNDRVKKEKNKKTRDMVNNLKEEFELD